MNKLILLLAAMLLTSIAAHSQNVKITGIVIDSAGTPLQMANVIAYGSNKSLGAFGITNQDGRYQLLGLKKDSTYTLKVSFLGLQATEEKVEKIQEDLVKNFVLLEGTDQLDAVQITYEMPVSIKGDTIVYNADSFTNGTERKLDDVLNKLPGVEVNEDGDVQVEGKNVEKIYVDGKEFFEGDTRLATKNIPADAIGKVEVLKNFNNVSQLKGLGNDQDRVAINIRLKEGKEKFWFGEATAAGGYGGDDFRYQAQPKAFYYSPNLSLNFLTDFNNLGIPAFTGRDYNRFTGQRFSNTSDAGVNVNTNSNGGRLTTFQNNRALEIESRFGAFNGAYQVNKSLGINAFAIFSSVDTDARTDSRRFFTPADESLAASSRAPLTEFTEDLTFQRNEQAIFKVGADYKPNDNFTLDFNGQVNIADNTERSALISDRVEINRETGDPERIIEDVAQRDAQKPIVIDQNLNMYYTASDRNIFAFEGRYVDSEEDPFYNAVRDFRDQQDPEPFNGRLNLDNADPYNINQRNLVDTRRINAKVDYWYVLNKISNINFTVGTIQSRQDYNSNIFQILDNGGVNILTDDDLVNDVRYDFSDIYAGVHYKIIKGKFTITPGFNVHQIETDTDDLLSDNDQTISTTEFLPDFNIRYDFRSSESLRADYRQVINFADVNSYAESLVFNNYNSLSRGNNNLSGAKTDQFSLNYNNFNMFNYTNIFAFVTYSKQREALQNSVELDGINQVNTTINSPLANESVNGTGRITKEFGKIRTGLRATLSYSLFNNIINDQAQESENFNQTYAVDLRSNYQEGVNFDVSYSYNLSNNDQGSRTTQFTTHRINLGADWQIGDAWQLTADYDLNLFRGEGQDNNFDFLEAALYYQQPDSQWEFKLAGTNLLGTEAFVSNNFGQIITSTTEQFVLPRYVYLQVQYEL
ncbi:outer membrane beta-barrel protein [Nonlabens ponticola]|uniref:Outer membrane protein beta-barrel domain-containing protein n=1 Tax=Nonlabens ponticola TaxID=2496866 RepID=A0A3S9MWH2_9FLAO|nr:outer membrane beta-barrel protein [Nonlabens ponticola]AZQ43463.1 hypothetical protein EJ995_04145 [Nonlabens ponticola]